MKKIYNQSLLPPVCSWAGHCLIVIVAFRIAGLWNMQKSACASLATEHFSQSKHHVVIMLNDEILIVWKCHRLGPLAPAPLDGAALSCCSTTILFISLPLGTLPFKVGECPCKIMFWLRFWKLRSWGAWDRVKMGAVRPQDKWQRQGLEREVVVEPALVYTIIAGEKGAEPLETLPRAVFSYLLPSMTHLWICCGDRGREQCGQRGSGECGKNPGLGETDLGLKLWSVALSRDIRWVSE